MSDYRIALLQCYDRRVSHMRIYTAVLLAALTSAPSAFTQRAPAPEAPRLVLVLAIDQMRFDYLTRFEPLYDGGLRTLIDRGAIFTNANYRQAATETGPGHSALLSGRYPRHSGIVANEWYDSYLKRPVNVVADPAQVPLGGPGRSASPVNAIGFTVGDVLKTRSPEARVVGVSLKDRSAILMGGLRADAAYWFENIGGNFITSSFYMDAAPQWLIEWNSRRAADAFGDRTWTRLLSDVSLYEKYAGPDAITGERDGKDTTFPHVFFARPPQTQHYVELRRTPFGDELTLDFTLEAMRRHQLGRDATTDILAIGFSATDSIGHAYGPDSQETMDQLLRLDRLVGRLFAEIESAVGLDNTLVILSSDHGARPLVEFERSRGNDGPRRVLPTVLAKAVNDAFASRFPGVAGLVSHFAVDFYLSEEVMRRHGLARKDVEDTAIAALLKTGVVDRVYTHDDLRATTPSSDPFLPLFRNAFFEPRSPHLTVLLKRDVYLTGAVGGSGHGSAYDFDRHVPVVFMGRGITPGRFADSSGPEDIAPTLAHLLGLEFPREHDSRVLLEMLRPVSASDR